MRAAQAVVALLRIGIVGAEGWVIGGEWGFSARRRRRRRSLWRSRRREGHVRFNFFFSLGLVESYCQRMGMLT
ncbi:hypothetical protein C8F04DRAFT_1170922 [Mycena alexandri]|uniref:Secreted protein n=1 Tax=Mycena alexandri TaxID=1745969 RepID=A0AAD6RZ10_9AGAR|nr:hypothetical protein C8F04DRAFT_1170922 [Mycena alexandri]